MVLYQTAATVNTREDVGLDTEQCRRPLLFGGEQGGVVTDEFFLSGFPLGKTYDGQLLTGAEGAAEQDVSLREGGTIDSTDDGGGVKSSGDAELLRISAVIPPLRSIREDEDGVSAADERAVGECPLGNERFSVDRRSVGAAEVFDPI